jgi:hypothetical protein
LPLGLATRVEESAKDTAEYQRGAQIIDRLKAGFKPIANGILVDAKSQGHLFNRIATMDFGPTGIEVTSAHRQETPRAMSARISSTRQAVIRGPSLIGFGNRPVFTPSHQVDLETGIGPVGARIVERRRKPVSGKTLFGMGQLHPLKEKAV